LVDRDKNTLGAHDNPNPNPNSNPYPYPYPYPNLTLTLMHLPIGQWNNGRGCERA